MKIANLRDLIHSQLQSKTTGEKFSLSANLNSITGFKDLFCTHEILLPGHKASSAHFHSLKEEMVFVLVGNPTVYLGDEKAQLNPGDFIAFVPMSAPHYFENLTSTAVELLMLCSNPADDVVGYT